MPVLRKRVRSANLMGVAGGALPRDYAHDLAPLSPEGIPNDRAPRSYDRIESDWQATEHRMIEAEGFAQYYYDMSRDRALPRADRREAEGTSRQWQQERENILFEQDINESSLYLQGRPIPTREERFQFVPDDVPSTPPVDPGVRAPREPNDMFPIPIASGWPETEMNSDGSG
jgi:hypothetical protein